MNFFRKKGFTLLELMIVVIIIGILASLAIPRFLVARDKAIMSEAKNMLGALRGAQIRFALENNNVYAIGTSGIINNLDVKPSDIAPLNESRYFTYYGASDANAGSYVAGAVGKDRTAMAGKAVWIIKDGTITEGVALP